MIRDLIIFALGTLTGCAAMALRRLRQRAPVEHDPY
jgi:hypothetical protein